MLLAMLMCGPQSKKKGSSSAALFVGLPGIEPDALPSNLASDLTVRFEYSSSPAVSFWGFEGVKGNARAGTPEITPVPVAGVHAARVVSE
jgi:hypothetical protein